MDTYWKELTSLSVGLLGFIVVGVSVTELLTPHIWPSAMIGLPVGLVVGAALVSLTYPSLSYWEETRATGRAARNTVRRFWTTAAALVGFVTGGGIAVAVLSTQAVGLASAILFAGVPVGVALGALAAYVVFRRDWDGGSPPASPV